MSKAKVLHHPGSDMRKSSREFVAPTKDQMDASGFMRPGDVYGVGYTQPVGKFKAGSMASGPIPQESVCFRSEEAIRK